jgi:hypothetical protein
MSERAHDHQEQEANPQLVPNQNVPDQAPVHQQVSPAAIAQRAIRAPGRPTPKQVLALQRTVGNQAVQRLVDGPQPRTVAPGTVQRHAPETLLRLSAVHGQHQSIINEAGVHAEHVQTGTEGWRQKTGELIGAMNELAGMVRSAGAEPCSQESGGEPEVPATGGF